MTIKQQGGVFGRHPTFSTANIEGDFTVDSGLLHVDADTGRIGVGTVAPLDTAGWGRAVDIRGASGSQGSVVYTGTSDASARAYFGTYATSYALIGTQTNHNMLVWINNQNIGSFTSNGFAPVNGNGIDFSATSGTGTSELFDDYEEGTWTPVYAPATGSFATITPVTSGSYVKVGRLVTAQFSVHTSGTLDLTGASGRLYFNGLPYAVSTGTFIEASGFTATVQRWNRGTDISTMRIAADPGASRFYGTWNNVNGSVDYIDVADMQTAGGNFENLIQGTLIYSAP